MQKYPLFKEYSFRSAGYGRPGEKGSLVTLREKRKGQLHKVFKDSFDAKPVFSQKFLIQKLNYIHHKPVSGKWMLAKNFPEYEHSSASFYEMQVAKHFTPVHYMDL